MSERITEEDLFEMDDDVAVQGVTDGARLIAEVRRLRGLIVGGSAEVNAVECGFSYGPQWNALLTEASAIREEQGR